MATSNSDKLDADVKKMKDSNFISYMVNLRGLYKDKPKQEAAAATVPSATASEPAKKKGKMIMGGANPDLHDEVRDNL